MTGQTVRQVPKSFRCGRPVISERGRNGCDHRVNDIVALDILAFETSFKIFQITFRLYFFS